MITHQGGRRVFFSFYRGNTQKVLEDCARLYKRAHCGNRIPPNRIFLLCVNELRDSVGYIAQLRECLPLRCFLKLLDQCCEWHFSMTFSVCVEEGEIEHEREREKEKYKMPIDESEDCKN